jgi:hypothetical protein
VSLYGFEQTVGFLQQSLMAGIIAFALGEISLAFDNERLHFVGQMFGRVGADCFIATVSGTGRLAAPVAESGIR